MCFYEIQISGERLQDHWSSGFTLTPDDCQFDVNNAWFCILVAGESLNV